MESHLEMTTSKSHEWVGLLTQKHEFCFVPPNVQCLGDWGSQPQPSESNHTLLFGQHVPGAFV
jgi:hypothetical protein